MIQRILAAAMILGSAMRLADPDLAPCAMCRGALDSPEGRELAGDPGRGTLLLLSVPFGAVGTIAWLIARAHPRAEKPAVGPREAGF